MNAGMLVLATFAWVGGGGRVGWGRGPRGGRVGWGVGAALAVVGELSCARRR